MSDSEPVLNIAANGGQLSSSQKQNGKSAGGKKSKQSGDDAAVAGPSNGIPSSAKKQKSRPAVQVISDPESDAESERSSSRSGFPLPVSTSQPDTVQNDSSWSFSEPTNTTLSASPLEVSSICMGEDAFKYILSGIEVRKFMVEHWEQEPLYIQRDNPQHYHRLNVSRNKIDEILRENSIEYTKNLDVTMYENGVRQTFNPDGRAYAASVWQYYTQGCSIRLLNPQTYIHALHKFNASLQEFFHCMVGANVYLTPPNSQGFAPHYDDIEAFVLQVEGQKEWLLYPPRSESEVLPRESSPNFQENEIGEPAFRHTLKPGDMLYFPRGWIHQARTVDGQHSLHITLSVYQKNAFADLFELMMKNALEQAVNSDVDFRCGLPVDIWQNFGFSYAQSDGGNDRRQKIKNHLKFLFRKIENYLDFDDGIDQMAMKFQHDALPPVLSSLERTHTSVGTMPNIAENGSVTMPEIRGKTEVRLLRANIVRLVRMDDAYHLYYYADNSKQYHEFELNFLESDEDTVGIIRQLIQVYPKYKRVRDLAPDNFDAAQAVVYELWDRGLLMTKAPLK